MRSRKPQRWRRVLTALALAGLGLIIAGVLLYALQPRFLRTDSNRLAVVSIILGMLSLLPQFAAIVRWSLLPARKQPVLSPGQLRHAQGELAEELLKLSKDEIDIRQLRASTPLGVRFRFTELPIVDHAELIFLQDRLPSGPAAFSGQADEAGIARLAEEFWELPKRRLVILGGAGAGKTSLALLLLNVMLQELTGELHGRQRGEPSAQEVAKPVPVLLTLAEWDPETGLYDWLAQRLDETYPVLHGFAAGVTRELVTRTLILPVLDGLDELPPPARVQVLAEFDKHDQPVIITCRTGEYAAAVADPAGRALTGAAVIELIRPQPDDVEAYLRFRLPPAGAGAGWLELFHTLQQHPEHPVSQALAIPVNIWLLRGTYADDRAKDPAELLNTRDFGTPDSVIRHLLDGLMPAVFRAAEGLRSPDSGRSFRPLRQWHLSDASRWLTFLARQVQHSGSPDIGWWHLNRYVASHRSSITASILARTGPGFMTLYLLLAALVVLLINVAAGTQHGSLARILLAVAGAAVVGAVLGSITKVRRAIASAADSLVSQLATVDTVPSYANIGRLLHRGVRAWAADTLAMLRSGSRVGLLTGSLGAAFGAVEVLLTRQLGTTLAVRRAAPLSSIAVVGGAGFVGGLLSFSLIVLASEASQRVTPDRPQTPHLTLRRDLQLAALSWLATGLPVGLGLGAAVMVMAYAYGTRFGLVAGTLVVVVLGAAWGLFFIISRASLWYLVSVAILRTEHQVPRRLMAFLDDAHRCGILRQVGALYQFRHVILTDYFAPPSPADLIARHRLSAPQRPGSWEAATAISVADELLADQRRVLGPYHPDTLATRSWLARLRGQAGDSAAAITGLQEALDDQLRILGPDHPHTLATRQALDRWRAARPKPAADPRDPATG